MRVVWTERAAQRLEEIALHVAVANPEAALALLDRLVERAEALALQPEMGRRVPELPGVDLRELIEPPYRLRGDRIEVLTVAHARRQFTMEGLG